MKVMKKSKCFMLPVVAAVMLGGCHQAAEEASTAPVATDKSAAIARAISDATTSPGKARNPFTVGYDIVGNPVVGSPVTVQLSVNAAAGPRPVLLEYRINDASSMLFAESQPDRISLQPADNETVMSQQVRVVPQRNGRLFLNVAASYETENGTVSTVTAIPIHVGQVSAAPAENGRLDVNEQGESIRVLESGS